MKFLEGNLLILAITIICWGVGGWLIAVHAFHLRQREQLLVGFGIGMVLDNWIANLLAQFISLPYAFWLAAILTLGFGLALTWPRTKDRIFNKPVPSISQWLTLFLLTFVFIAIGRGLAIFDEFQTLSTLSILAAGKVPPLFILNPDLRFGYHYFLLLFAAQIMRVGAIYPWNALDLSRSIALSLTLMLGGLWAWRLTKNRIVALLTGMMVAFATGTRWMLLLLPSNLLNMISQNITLMGSGAATGADLSQALINPWVIEGDGPMPFPFAFADGISHPLVMAYNGIGAMALLILILLLMTADRRKNQVGGLVTAVIISSLALANEVTFGLLYLGFGIAILAEMIRKKSAQIPKGFLPWLAILGAAGALSLVQGGMFTEILRGWLGRGAGGTRSSYYTFDFHFAWPPVLISVHLGELSLGNPFQLLAALVEIGPIILALPFAMIWGIKKLRGGEWYEAGLVGSAVAGLGALFFIYSGNAGISATTRFLEGTLWITKLYAIPALWIWSRRRSKIWEVSLLTLGLAAMLGGIVHFSIGLVAAGKPVYSYYISDMDAEMVRDYWNQLEPDALIFGPIPYRAPTVFGRYTDGFITWGQSKPEWDALAEAPDPYRLHAFGYNYVYFDIRYWEKLDKQYQDLLSSSCVKLVEQHDGFRSEKDYRKDFRQLLNISECR